MRHPGLLKRWAERADIPTFEESPWTPFDRKMAECRVALITTGGIHLAGQLPFDMNHPGGDPTYREIPNDTDVEELIITHNYYDHSDADQDVNIIFPIERLRFLEQLGEIGEASPRHFSLMGHITNGLTDRLTGETAPGIIAALKHDAVDAVLLTPA